MWKRVLRRVLLAIAALPVLWAIVIFGLRSLAPSAAQQHALALIDAPQSAIERNAFAALWFSEYAIPTADMATALERDITAYNALPPGQRGGFRSTAHERYPQLPPLAPGIDCGRPLNCLEAVRKDPDTTRALLHTHARRIENAEALANYDGVRWPFVPDPATAFPHQSFSDRLVPLAAAQQFADGDQSGALDRICRWADTNRRLTASAGDLIGALLSAAATRSAAEQTAAFLAELPADFELPTTCAQAFAPPTLADLHLCDAVKHERRMSLAYFAQTNPPQRNADEGGPAFLLRRVSTYFVLDEANFPARFAPVYARYCAAALDAPLLADTPVTSPDTEIACPWHAWISDPAGCVLTQISSPVYGPYQQRMQDHAARIRMLGALLWWRDQHAEESPQTRLSRVPSALQSAGHPLGLSEDARHLYLPLFDVRGGETQWQLPLPCCQ